MSDSSARTFCDVPHIEEPAAGSAEVVVIGASHGTPYAPGEPGHAAAAPAAIRAATDWYCSGPEQFDLDSGSERFAGARLVDAAPSTARGSSWPSGPCARRVRCR
jgi:hypothetical protein